MKVVVTGASGFIGSHVTAALVQEGHDVCVALREDSRRRWTLDLPLEERRWDPEAPEAAAALVAGADAVVDVAGITRSRDVASFLRVNAERTESLAVAAAAEGVGRFVFVSSLAARGPDQAAAPGDAPVSWYGLSKKRAEIALAAIAERTGLAVVVLRPAAVYGPRDRDLLPTFRSASRGLVALPPNDLPLQPAYVTDVAAAVVGALASEAPGFGPWPVAEAAAYRWRDVARAIERVLGRTVLRAHVPPTAILAAGRLSESVAAWRGRSPAFDLRRAEDVAVFSYTADVAPTMRALAWSPAVDLERGIALTLAWYRREGWLR